MFNASSGEGNDALVAGGLSEEADVPADDMLDSVNDGRSAATPAVGSFAGYGWHRAQWMDWWRG